MLPPPSQATIGPWDFIPGAPFFYFFCGSVSGCLGLCVCLCVCVCFFVCVVIYDNFCFLNIFCWGLFSFFYNNLGVPCGFLFVFGKISLSTIFTVTFSVCSLTVRVLKWTWERLSVSWYRSGFFTLSPSLRLYLPPPRMDSYDREPARFFSLPLSLCFFLAESSTDLSLAPLLPFISIFNILFQSF